MCKEIPMIRLQTHCEHSLTDDCHLDEQLLFPPEWCWKKKTHSELHHAHFGTSLADVKIDCGGNNPPSGPQCCHATDGHRVRRSGRQSSQQCHVALSALTNVDIAANANRCKIIIRLYLLKHGCAVGAAVRRPGVAPGETLAWLCLTLSLIARPLCVMLFVRKTC